MKLCHILHCVNYWRCNFVTIYVMYIRLDEQAEKSQTAIKGELNSRVGSPANENGENDDDVRALSNISLFGFF